MQKLPIGIQHFNRLRQEDYLYVDKITYHNRDKSIMLLGIAFDKEQRAISDWQSELVPG